MNLLALLTIALVPNLQTDPPAAQAHIAKAREIAGADLAYLVTLFDKQPGGGGGGEGRPPSAKDAGTFKPAKIFDDLYVIGEASVVIFALTTPKGIVLIDSGYGYFPEQIILPQMAKLGLRPADVKYVLITHGHPDHAFGAGYFQAKGARIMASDADWDAMENPRSGPGGGPGAQGTFPKRDLTITDGQKFTFGDLNIDFYLTPGHTAGTVSMLIPVKDRGATHTAALWGGSGFSRFASLAKSYPASLKRFANLADRAKADVFLSNHPFVDGSIEKVAALQTRAAGAPNPFVVGQKKTRRIHDVIYECAEAWWVRVQAGPGRRGLSK